MSDGYPLGADCDLDALVEWRYRDVPQRYVLSIHEPFDSSAVDWSTLLTGDVILNGLVVREVRS